MDTDGRADGQTGRMRGIRLEHYSSISANFAASTLFLPWMIGIARRAIAARMNPAEMGRSIKIRKLPPEMMRACRRASSIIKPRTIPKSKGAPSKRTFFIR